MTTREDYLRTLFNTFVGEKPAKMEDLPEKTGAPVIDVKKVLESKNPALARLIPGFLINYLKRIIHQDELNRFLEENKELRDLKLIAASLDLVQIRYRVFGEENLPKSGRYIFASNHPLGGLDGLVFINEVSKHFSDVKFPVNDILTNLESLSGIFLPVNKHGGQGKDAAAKLEETYASNSQILYFPAGLCSRKRNGKICDLTWHKSFIVKAIKHKRDVVPVFFSGRNSNFFYNLANIRKRLGIGANIEMLYLPDEMFSQKGKEIAIVFGKPVPWQTFDKSKSAPEWADWVKNLSYSLESQIRR